jgi:hypothetical protein
MPVERRLDIAAEKFPDITVEALHRAIKVSASVRFIEIRHYIVNRRVVRMGVPDRNVYAKTGSDTTLQMTIPC